MTISNLGTPGIFTAGWSRSKTGVAAGVITSSITWPHIHDHLDHLAHLDHLDHLDHHNYS